MRKFLVIQTATSLVMFLAGLAMAIYGALILLNANIQQRYVTHIEESLEYSIRDGKVRFKQVQPPSREACAHYVQALQWQAIPNDAKRQIELIFADYLKRPDLVAFVEANTKKKKPKKVRQLASETAVPAEVH